MERRLFGLSAGLSALVGMGIGAAVGAGIDYLNDGKIDDGYAWKGALIGGVLGAIGGIADANTHTMGNTAKNVNNGRKVSLGKLKHPRFIEWQEAIFTLAKEGEQVYSATRSYSKSFSRNKRNKKFEFEFNEFWGSASQTIRRKRKNIWNIGKDWQRIKSPIFRKRGRYTVTHTQKFPDKSEAVEFIETMPDGTIHTFVDIQATPVLDIKLTVRRLLKGRRGKSVHYGWKRISR